MPSGFQTIPYPLGSIPFVAGQLGRVRLRDLPLELLGRIAHVHAFTIRSRLVPAYTTAPTVVGHNAAIAKVDFYDGAQSRDQISGNALRMFENLETGSQISAEAPVGGGTGNPRYTTRYLSVGPPKMIGNPSDFAICNANLLNGEVRITNGQLTDISPDCTACTGEHEITAHLVLKDEINIPPFYERMEYAISNDESITAKGLYAFLALANSANYDAFAAGDIGSVNVFIGKGQTVQGVNAPELTRCFNNEMMAGQIGGVAGDPFNATYDVAQREVNLTTPTALQARALNLQPILWCPPDTRLSKIPALVENALRLKTGGSQTSGTVALVGRFLAQDKSRVVALANQAAEKLNRFKGGIVKLSLLSKKDSYTGPLADFLPYVCKAA